MNLLLWRSSIVSTSAAAGSSWTSGGRPMNARSLSAGVDAGDRRAQQRR